MMKAMTRVVRSAYAIPGAGPAAAATWADGGTCQFPPAVGADEVGGGAAGIGAAGDGAAGGGADAAGIGATVEFRGPLARGFSGDRGLWIRSPPDRIRHRLPPSPVLVRRLGGSIERHSGLRYAVRVPDWNHFGSLAADIGTGRDSQVACCCRTV